MKYECEACTRKLFDDEPNPCYDCICSECGELIGQAGDGYDGLCADCADRAENEKLTS